MTSFSALAAANLNRSFPLKSDRAAIGATCNERSSQWSLRQE
jgi:hypothetical protein